MSTIILTKRASGGFTLQIDGEKTMFSSCEYFANEVGGVGLYLPSGLKILNQAVAEMWTVGSNTGFTNTEALVSALDNIGISSLPTLIVAQTGVNSSEPSYVDSNFTLTRPANTIPYSDGDAILDKIGITTQKFAAIAKSAGKGVNFINLLAFTNDTGLAGKTINVVFYKESPTNPIADNAAFSYASGNELIRKGTVQLTFGTGILAGVAQLGVDSNGMINLELCPTVTDVFIQVWLPTGYTPSANSTYILFKASAIQN